jgi:hypothetical protein
VSLPWFRSLLLKAKLSMKRQEVWIYLQPHGVTIVRMTGWPRRRVLARRSIKIAAQPSLAAKASFHDAWRPAVAVLGEVLRDTGWQLAAPRIVLSSHFVRYCLIPWHAGLTTRSEFDAYLRHCFLMAYGETAREWDIRCSPAGFGRPALASGVSIALLEALRLELEQVQMTPGEISPNLMVAVNETMEYLGKEKQGSSSWFVSVEAGRICLAMFHNGEWRSLVNTAAEPQVAEQLSAMIQRESIIAGLDTDGWPIVVHRSAAEEPGRLSLPGRVVDLVPTSLFATETYREAAA